MSILKEISEAKRDEVNRRKQATSIAMLEQSANFARTPISLKRQLQKDSTTGIIAEFKHRSPSKGVINAHAAAYETAQGYETAGASAMSVLTESNFFGGCDQDLIDARRAISLPILRKDFIIDAFQITEAKALGADVVLLIAALLDKQQLTDLYQYASSIGLEALIEVHDAKELDKLPVRIEIIGVNSRNLSNFKVDLQHTAEIAGLLPQHALRIAESGISSVEDYITLKEMGFSGFLMGEFFMREQNPPLACAKFIEAIKHAENEKNAQR